jgi:hypothetical protein
MRVVSRIKYYKNISTPHHLTGLLYYRSTAFPTQIFRKLLLGMMNPEAEVFVALFNANGTSDTFDIEDVTENHGHAQIEIYEEEPGA